jgi:hypothetical protein
MRELSADEPMVRDVVLDVRLPRIARFDAGPDGVTFLAYYLLGDGQEPAIAFPAS